MKNIRTSGKIVIICMLAQMFTMVIGAIGVVGMSRVAWEASEYITAGQSAAIYETVGRFSLIVAVTAAVSLILSLAFTAYAVRLKKDEKEQKWER